MASRIPTVSIRPRQRVDGSISYNVRYRRNGQATSTAFSDEASAKKWAAVVRQVGVEEALGLLDLDVDTSVTVAEYAEQYISGKSGVEPGTLDVYRTYVRTSIGPAMGSIPLEAVSPRRVAEWVNHCVALGNAPKTVANRHGFLYAMFQHAVDEGLLTKNPCVRTRLPRGERQEMTFLTPAEFKHLYEYIPDRWKVFVLFLVSTGLRFGEATALRPTDFDLDACEVRITRAWKRSKERAYYLGPPKTRRSRRTVTFQGSLADLLRPLIESAGELVFVNQVGGPIRQPKFGEGVWEPARNLAMGKPAFSVTKRGNPWSPKTNGGWETPPSNTPLKKRPRVHDLRHTHASWLIQAGVPLTVIQRRLGHESIQTTSDTYGHLTGESERKAAAVADDLLDLT